MGAAIAGALIGAFVSAGLGAGISAASQPGAIVYPDPYGSMGELAAANAQLLPKALAEEAAAQEGGSIQVPNTGYTTSTQQVVMLPGGGTVPYVASDWAPPSRDNPKGGQYWQPGQQPPKPITEQVETPNTGTKSLNFAGYGTADVQGNIAAQTAAADLALRQQFDPAYIAQALASEQQANPQGVAARQQEATMIQNEVAHPTTDPVGEQLAAQVQQQIEAARNGQMTPQEQAQYQSAINSASAGRGGGPVNATPFETPLLTGAAGEARQQAAAQEGTGFLASGATPGDFTYRQQQQAISDLSSLVNGTTPESQFNSLTGAQRGATPNSGNANLSTLPQDTSGAATAGINATNTARAAAAGNVGSWAAGLSGALGVGQILAAA